MGAVDDDLQPAGTSTPGTALAELDVATGGVVDTLDLAEPRGRHGFSGRSISASMASLDLIRQLVAVGGEELDAVVVVGVVRGGDDDAGGGAEGAGQIGDAGVGIGPSRRMSTPAATRPASRADSNM
jgi:hypothetical protein